MAHFLYAAITNKHWRVFILCGNARIMALCHCIAEIDDGTYIMSPIIRRVFVAINIRLNCLKAPKRIGRLNCAAMARRHIMAAIAASNGTIAA